MPRAIVIGAGIGGIATAIRLSAKGFEVDVFEANKYPGGKLTEIEIEGFRFDAGPSLFTLPQLVDELFEISGEDPRAHFNYDRLDIICNYFWNDGTRFTSFSDIEKTKGEIKKVFGIDGSGFEKALNKAATIYKITDHVFLEQSLHKRATYFKTNTLVSMMKLGGLGITTSMHKANKKRLKEPKLVQYFDRYATYNGSDPYQAPATLNLIPHLEHHIGAFFPKGGMHAITNSLVALAERKGVKFHFEERVDELLKRGNRVCGVRIGEKICTSEIVVNNIDVVPFYKDLHRDTSAFDKVLSRERSSSALIFYWGVNREFPELDVHNILFADDYQAEFNSIFKTGEVFDDPTIYIHISSKAEQGDAPSGMENWFVMVNQPSRVDIDWNERVPVMKKIIIEKISKVLNVELKDHIVAEDLLSPELIQSRTGSFLGALYGTSSNSKTSAFLRHPNFSKQMKGLYFVGGSVHPGGGIPLCLCSAAIVDDLIG